MEITIHTKGITGSMATAPGEEPAVQFGLLVEIDGVLQEKVTNARVGSVSDGIQEVFLRVMPSRVKTIDHDGESWDALLRRLEMADLNKRIAVEKQRMA